MKPEPMTVHRPNALERNADDEWVSSGFTDHPAKGWVEPASPTRMGREFTIGRQTVVIDAVAVITEGTRPVETDELTHGLNRYRVRTVFEMGSFSGNLDYVRCDLQVIRP